MRTHGGSVRIPAVSLGIVAILASSGLKAAVDRPRPHFATAVAHATSAAFPSGHALGSAALCATAALLLRHRLDRWQTVTVAVVVPVLVGVARVLLGVHWPSDVVAGLCIGGVIAVAGQPVGDTENATSATTMPTPTSTR
jgi:undecaprenyl-diphosphatase